MSRGTGRHAIDWLTKFLKKKKSKYLYIFPSQSLQRKNLWLSDFAEALLSARGDSFLKPEF